MDTTTLGFLKHPQTHPPTSLLLSCLPPGTRAIAPFIHFSPLLLDLQCHYLNPFTLPSRLEAPRSHWNLPFRERSEVGEVSGVSHFPMLLSCIPDAIIHARIHWIQHWRSPHLPRRSVPCAPVWGENREWVYPGGSPSGDIMGIYFRLQHHAFAGNRLSSFTTHPSGRCCSPAASDRH